jgi:hypothetical protein
MNNAVSAGNAGNAGIGTRKSTMILTRVDLLLNLLRPIAPQFSALSAITALSSW